MPGFFISARPKLEYGRENTVKQAQNVSGTEKVHAIRGVFQLINAKAERIQSTIADIKAMKPDHIVPAHCTGFEALVAFSKEMPDAFEMNTAGTRYTFGAQASGNYLLKYK